jgi:hypothetical protein
LPLVLMYQPYAYRVFRGKVHENGLSYATPVAPNVHARRTHERETALHLS